jgi:beta-galactosidase
MSKHGSGSPSVVAKVRAPRARRRTWLGSLGVYLGVLLAAGCGSSGSNSGNSSVAGSSNGAGTAGAIANAGAAGVTNASGAGGAAQGGNASAGQAGNAGSGGAPAQAGTRVDTILNSGWTFQKADVTGAEAPTFDDSAWTQLDLPHTWNALDGQDGPATPYYRGIGWYRKHYTVPSSLMGQRLYLQFDGSNIITDVYVNGKAAGSHAGGFAAFRFDVTNLVTLGSDNVIAVKVNNGAGVDANNVIVPGSPTANVPPLNADFTFFGGLYRSVHFLSTPPLAISPMDFSSSGVYVKQTNVSAASADLALTVKLSNAGSAAAMASLKATVLDATNAEVLSLTINQSVPASGLADGTATGTLTNPHLWNGLADPYLYSVRVDLLDGSAVSDSVTVPLGLRSFSLDPNTGFTLNGKYLDLHGVDKHQDHKDKGWAIADTDTDADFAIIKELGATVIRLAHYQHAQHTYDVTDRSGVVVWAETPVVDRINDTPEFAANAQQQLTELIRQNYNHPSIVFWSVGNETLLKAGPSPDTLISHLADVVATEDPTRIAAYAANAGDTYNPVNWHGTAHGFNEYQGWYGGKVADFATWADQTHKDRPTGSVGLTEYGAGASITQHAANPAAQDLGADHTSSAHTEEYQAYYHEGYWSALSTRPFIWGKFVWNLFDFASDTRSEGTTPGLNDKGLVTFDRQTKKDAFYWYKANWSTDPFVYITSRRFTALPKSSTSIRVYSNAAMVSVSLNGNSFGAKSAANHIFVWDNVTWAAGSNVVVASAGTQTDSVTWTN